MLDITFSYFFEFLQLFIAEWCASKIGIERVSADIVLQIIMSRSSDIDGHIFDIIGGVQSFRYRRPVFVIDLAFEQYL